MAQSPKSRAGCSTPVEPISSLPFLLYVLLSLLHFILATKTIWWYWSMWASDASHFVFARVVTPTWRSLTSFSIQLTHLKAMHKGLPGRANRPSSPGSLYIRLLDSCQIWSEGFVAVSILGEGDHDSLRAVMLLWIMHLWMRSWDLEFFIFGFEFQVLHLAMWQGKFLLPFET